VQGANLGNAGLEELVLLDADKLDADNFLIG